VRFSGDDSDPVYGESTQSPGFVADPETLDAPIVLMARNV